MGAKDALQRRISELCRERGLSVSSLGRRCGLRQSTLNNIISGRNRSATIHTVARICRGLEIPMADFFDSDHFRRAERESA